MFRAWLGCLGVSGQIFGHFNFRARVVTLRLESEGIFITMAAASTSAEKKPFEISRVAALTFDLIRREFAMNYGFTVAILAVPSVLYYLASHNYMQVLGQVRYQGSGAVLPSLGGLLLTSVLSMLAYLLIYGVLSWGAVERLQGRTPALGDRLNVAVRALPVLAGVGILGYLGIVFGLILLLIPGLMLATMWLLVVPGAVTEKTGVFGAFRRSGELTKGHRWAIFLMLIIVWVGSVLIALVGPVLVHAASGAAGPWYNTTYITGPAGIITLVINILVGGLIRTVEGVGLGVAYHELRRSNGEYDSRSLGDVFA